MKQIDNICIEKITRILGELVKGYEITKILAKFHFKDHDTESGNRDISTKWKRMNASMIYEIDSQKSPRPFFQLIEEIMHPVKFANNKAVWDKNLEEINFTLRFYGYELTDGGKIQSTISTKTYSEGINRTKNFLEKLQSKGIHENIIKYCSPELLNENFFHAILEASKSILFRIKQMVLSSRDGNNLIMESFDPKNPAIIINGNYLKTDNEKNEYFGLRSLLMYICYTYRNPTAHSPKTYNPLNEEDAILAFQLMSKVHYQLDNCQVVRHLN